MPRRRATTGAKLPPTAALEFDPRPEPDLADDRPARLAASLGLQFQQPDLLRLALTHRSVVHDFIAAGGNPVLAASATNERLEFLGDAMLGAIVGEYLYLLDPLADEGQLTQRRVALVRAESLVRWARELDLGAYLYLGQGEQPTISNRDRMLAGAFEALVGAIAVDRGYDAARRFMMRFLRRKAAASVDDVAAVDNPKGRLQELLLEQFKATPTYRVTAATGPEHAREFTVAVSYNGVVLGTGTGSSKREAEQRAAAAALALVTAETVLATVTGDDTVTSQPADPPR